MVNSLPGNSIMSTRNLVKGSEDSDDEFFGNQDEDGDFGAMQQQENQARAHELKTIGFMESYDEYKDSLLQEGFNKGYQDTFEFSRRIGELLGKHTVNCILENPAATAVPSTPSSERLVAFLQQWESQPKDHTLDTVSGKLKNLGKDLAKEANLL